MKPPITILHPPFGRNRTIRLYVPAVTVTSYHEIEYLSRSTPIRSCIMLRNGLGILEVDCRWLLLMLESFRRPGDAVMLDRFRTPLARLIVQHLNRPLLLVIHAWLWLAPDTDDVEEKWRCLQAVLELNPEHQAARGASVLLFQREVKRLQRESIADDGLSMLQSP